MRWSFSAYEAYNTCPKQFQEVKLLKNYVEVPKEAQLWGTRVHEALEVAVRDGVPLPEGMQQWQELADKLRLRDAQVLCELELGITKELKATDFHADDVWCRGIIDYACLGPTTALALDYKTGKRKLTDQLKLMALLMFAHYQELQTVHTGFVWLKFDSRIDSDTFHRKDIVKLWKDFMPRLQQMRESEKLGLYPSKKSGLCRNHCVVTSCAYNGNYRGLK